MAETFYYAPDTDLKAETLVPFAGGVLLPTWYRPDAWLLTGEDFVQSAVSGVGGSGFVAAFAGGGATFLLQHHTYLIQYLASGAAGGIGYFAIGISAIGLGGTGSGSVTVFPTLSGSVYTGGAAVSGSPYLVDSVGNLATVVGSGVVAMTPTPAFGSTPARMLGAIGGKLYTLLPTASGLGTFTLSGATSGVSGFVAAPIGTLGVLAVSGQVAAAGWNNVTFASGYTGLAVEPTGGLELLGVRSGALDVYATAGSGIWSLAQTISGVGAPVSVSWSPNNRYAFTTDTTAGTIRVFTNTLGVLALTQTLTIPGPMQVAITADSINGLVARPGSNTLSALQFSGSTWNFVSSTALTGASSVLALSNTTMVAGFASGIALLTLLGSSWTITASGTLPFTPTALASDGNGLIYAAGTQAGSGRLAAVSGTTMTASGAYTGNATGLLVEQGQIVAIDSVNNIVHYFANINNTLVQQSTSVAPAGARAIAGTTTDIFIAGTAITGQYTFGGPFELNPQKSGMVSIYDGAAWHSATLGVSGIPEALAWDPSGNVTVATLQNCLYTVSPSGAVLSSGVVNQIEQQDQSVPVGISSLLWVGNVLYASTSLNDTMIRVN